jgi:hypothetical protein
MVVRGTCLAVLMLSFALSPLSPLSRAAPAPTADQQLVAGLGTAKAALRSALESLSRPSTQRASKANRELARGLAALDTATRAAPRAVGALDTPSVRIALRDARALTRRARRDVSHRRYAAARAEIARAMALKTAALADFGVPLAKEFTSFAINRDFHNVPGFEDYSGFSAKVGEEVTEIVIGPANRATANAGEAGVSVGMPDGLPITAMSVAVISDPIGRFTSGWCQLDSGLITCRVRPAMPTDRTFTIAFGPKLAPGTKVLVKFRSPSGQRSYTIFSTR